MRRTPFHKYLVLLSLTLAASAQSSDQNFPTAITSNEITGVVRARDMGDARLTTYYYAFNGVQGDIFVNVVTRNFSGDIDVFNADGMRPLTKMVIYADSAVAETGRLLYLRKSERLLLRLQGRSPNDDPATFQIKFGGSFRAAVATDTEDAPIVERTGEEPGVRVNTVGTILPPIPKPSPEKKPAEALAVKSEQKTEKKVEEKPIDSNVQEALKANSDADTGTVFENKTAKVTTEPLPKSSPKRTPPAAKAKTPSPPKTKPVEEKKPDPLASIRLIVQMKDGEVIERPMSEVVKFSVDKGILTVIGKGGKVSKYSILDVAKVTIE